MIQKCPNCGHWCEATKDGILAKAGRGFTDVAVGGAEIGESIGGLFGKTGEKIGSFLVSAASGATGLAPLNAVKESLFGSDYKFQCSECGYEWEVDDENDDQTEEYEQELAEYEYEQQHRQKLVELQEQSLQLARHSDDEVKDFEEHFRSLLSDDDTEGYKASLYDTLAYVKYKSGDKNGALDAINLSIQYYDAPDAHATKGVIMAMGENRTAFDKYKALQELVKYKEENGIPYWATNGEMDNLIEEQTLSFANDFLSIPYRQRKFIVISDQDYVMLPDNLKVVPWKYLPTEMQFSEGHPVVGEVYVCHPYKETYYLPLDTYQIELFRDELSELRYLLQCLGAKSIEIEDRNRNEESATSAKNMGGHVRAEYKGIGGGVNGSHSNEQETFQTAVNDCLVSQSFSKPKEKAHVPEDLVWYPHRKSWQDLVRQLKMGNVDSHHVTVSTSDCSQVSAKESSSLEIEVNALVAAGGIGGNYDTSSMFKSETNKSWTLKVDFYPYEEEKTPLVKQETSQLFAAPNNAIGNQTRWLIYGLVALIVILGAIIAFLAL